MNIYSSKAVGAKGQNLVANTVSKAENAATSQLIDNRPYAVTQKKLQEAVNNRSQPCQYDFISRGVMIQRKGYNSLELVTKLADSQYANGICNGLTAAWLSGFISTTTDNPLGVSDANLESIITLKQMLDDMQCRVSEEYSPGDLTHAFIIYLKRKGQMWFDELETMSVTDYRAEFEAFRGWFNVSGHDLITRDDDDDDKSCEGVQFQNHSGVYAAQGNNDKLNITTIYKLIENALEKNFGLFDDFKGIVRIDAYNDSEHDDSEHDDSEYNVSHQFAIRYSARKNKDSTHGRYDTYASFNGILEILDQNSSYGKCAIIEEDDIADSLSHYVHTHYIKHPMMGRSAARIEINIL